MTTTEIKALVASKIAGQGTNVDAASVLPTIINELCDLIDAASAAAPKVLVSTKAFESWDEDVDTAAEAAAVLGITEEELNTMENYSAIKFTNATLLLSWINLTVGDEFCFGGDWRGGESYNVWISRPRTSMGSYLIQSSTS